MACFTHVANRMRYDAPHQAGSQMLTENEMSSQILVRTNMSRTRLVRAALVIFADRIHEGLSAFARRFMDALRESRQRQAEQVMRRYRDLMDDSRD